MHPQLVLHDQAATFLMQYARGLHGQLDVGRAKTRTTEGCRTHDQLQNMGWALQKEMEVRQLTRT